MSNNAEIVRTLKSAALFKNFTDTGLQIVASIAQTKRIPPNTPLFVENMIGEGLYVIADGMIRLAVRGPNGQETTLTMLSAGDSLGEAAILRQGPRLCSATAEVESTVLEITRRDIALLQRSKPQACLKLMMGVVELIGERLQKADPDFRQFLAWRLDV
ncbi:MAG: cyclic nucleotide-binding domain-containing protein [Deltaproteobacteria bacterium]|jgi:CRP/FNR family cyclic AMP-dependent transcriptional regulator